MNYINRYHLIHKRVISEANKKENDRKVKSVNYSTKEMWQLINKHTGKLHTSDQDIQLKTDLEKIINPQTVVDKLNSFFIDCIEDLLVQNKSYINGQTAQLTIK